MSWANWRSYWFDGRLQFVGEDLVLLSIHAFGPIGGGFVLVVKTAIIGGFLIDLIQFGVFY